MALAPPPKFWRKIRDTGDLIRHKLGNDTSPLTVFYDPRYRLPLPDLEATLGIETRRADFVAWFLQDQLPDDVELVEPPRVGYDELSLVHDAELLEGLTDGSVFERLFHLNQSELATDALMLGFRLAAGGTLAAARRVLSMHDGPRVALNLLGGFHHASPKRASGLCPINDIAVAVAALRRDGFLGQIVIIDTDAHPPDGIAKCLADDDKVHITSLSGSDWGEIDADETLLAEGTSDDEYLAALAASLARAPKPKLAFVIAGGDVLAKDHMGMLGLSLEGTRARDVLLLDWLDQSPAVFVPGGGYHKRSWQVLALTACVLAGRPHFDIPHFFDPLHVNFKKRYRQFTLKETLENALFTDDDIDELLGRRTPQTQRFLGRYLSEDVERALAHYGIIEEAKALGYSNLSLELSKAGDDDRLAVRGEQHNAEHLLFDLVASTQCLEVEGVELKTLFVNWLTLRDPVRTFSKSRGQLPGQDAPGLGLAREATTLLGRIAERLKLEAVQHRPAYFHVAYVGKRRYQFADARRQGRFLAMLRDLGDAARQNLAHFSQAVDDGEIVMMKHGESLPYQWEADDLVWCLGPEAQELMRSSKRLDTIENEKDCVRFVWPRKV